MKNIDLFIKMYEMLRSETFLWISVAFYFIGFMTLSILMFNL